MEKGILVLGDGGWGTALGILLHNYGHRVVIWGNFPGYIREMNETRINRKFLPGIKIPNEISLISGNVLPDADFIIVAIPTQFIRPTLLKLAPTINPNAVILSVAKGIEIGRLRRPSEIICSVLRKSNQVAVLSGPSHAREVASNLPANVVVASRDFHLARRLQRLLSGELFRVYTNNDLIGVELGGALKNVVAIAAGICDGLKLGANSKAALLSRGIWEISRLGEAMGAKRQTFFGLSGIGDLITTCYSPDGRNLFVGREIGKGKKLKSILRDMVQIAEGIWTTKAVLTLMKKFNVDMPIAKEVYRVLFKNKKPLDAVRDLMTRVPKPEWSERR